MFRSPRGAAKPPPMHAASVMSPCVHHLPGAAKRSMTPVRACHAQIVRLVDPCVVASPCLGSQTPNVLGSGPRGRVHVGRTAKRWPSPARSASPFRSPSVAGLTTATVTRLHGSGSQAGAQSARSRMPVTRMSSGEVRAQHQHAGASTPTATRARAANGSMQIGAQGSSLTSGPFNKFGQPSSPWHESDASHSMRETSNHYAKGMILRESPSVSRQHSPGASHFSEGLLHAENPPAMSCAWSETPLFGGFGGVGSRELCDDSPGCDRHSPRGINPEVARLERSLALERADRQRLAKQLELLMRAQGGDPTSKSMCSSVASILMTNSSLAERETVDTDGADQHKAEIDSLGTDLCDLDEGSFKSVHCTIGLESPCRERAELIALATSKSEDGRAPSSKSRLARGEEGHVEWAHWRSAHPPADVVTSSWPRAPQSGCEGQGARSDSPNRSLMKRNWSGHWERVSSCSSGSSRADCDSVSARDASLAQSFKQVHEMGDLGELSLQAPDLQDPVSTVPPEAPFSPELHDSRRSGSATPSPDVGSRVLRFYRLKCLELESQVHERDAEVTRLRQALTEATGDTTSPSSPVSESSQVMTGSLVAD